MRAPKTTKDGPARKAAKVAKTPQAAVSQPVPTESIKLEEVKFAPPPALRDRVRRVDLSQMNDTDAAVVAQQVGNKVNDILVEAKNRANDILSIYGLNLAIFEVKIVEQDVGASQDKVIR